MMHTTSTCTNTAPGPRSSAIGVCSSCPLPGSSHYTSTMDVNFAVAASASSTPEAGAGKKRGVAQGGTTKKGRSHGKGSHGKSAEKDSIQELLAMVAKLTLQSARDIAVIKSVVMRVALFNKEDTLIPQEVKTATTGYANTVKELAHEQKEDFGPPHPFIWHVLMQIIGKVDGGQKYKDCIAHVQDIHSRALELQKTENGKDLAWCMRALYAEQVKVVRISRTWNAKVMKMEVAVTEGSLAQKAMLDLMTHLKTEAKAKIKHGAAPKSDLERKVARMVAVVAPQEEKED
eukprot:TRINITY_DN30565_c0_g1_i3.p2 TRINITY_DN30565_c0_g1~~TRINITY_DN30565_c0_g1_i3.p2  ORF type:complete len:289 (-),score=85.48 TRINITY_DN30565_c0_g1_i3:966-1832(-)